MQRRKAIHEALIVDDDRIWSEFAQELIGCELEWRVDLVEDGKSGISAWQTSDSRISQEVKVLQLSAKQSKNRQLSWRSSSPSQKLVS